MFLIIWIIYIFFIGENDKPMPSSIISLTASIVDKHSLNIDEYNYSVDNAYYNGHYYSGLAPGTSFLAVPIYFLIKILFNVTLSPITQQGIGFVLTIFTTSFFGALSSMVLLKIGEIFSKNNYRNLLIISVYAFGTSIFIYSSVLLSRAIASFILILAYYIILKIKYGKYNSNLAYLAGFLCGLSVSFDYLTLIFIPCLLVYLYLSFKDVKIISLFFLGTWLPLILLGIYHYLIFGNLFDVPYNHRIGDEPMYIHSLGILGFTSPTIERMNVMLLSPNSIFLYMPILILSILNIFKFIAQKKFIYENIFILSTFTIYYFLLSLYYAIHWAGYANRFLLPIIPFLMIPLFFVKLNHKNNFFKASFIILSIISVYNTIIGAMKFYNVFFINQQNNYFSFLKKFFHNEPNSNYLVNIILSQNLFMDIDDNLKTLIKYLIPLALMTGYLIFFIIIYKKSLKKDQY